MSKFEQFRNGDKWSRINTETGEIRDRGGRWPGVRVVDAPAAGASQRPIFARTEPTRRARRRTP